MTFDKLVNAETAEWAEAGERIMATFSTHFYVKKGIKNDRG